MTSENFVLPRLHMVEVDPGYEAEVVHDGLNADGSAMGAVVGVTAHGFPTLEINDGETLWYIFATVFRGGISVVVVHIPPYDPIVGAKGTAKKSPGDLDLVVNRLIDATNNLGLEPQRKRIEGIEEVHGFDFPSELP
ncbi:MAG: hypothetical protein Q8R28_14915 [Dehalococcoidia bacterium]|nr:hypothetical protein [Dehalococcoidia bacterium]